MNFPNFLQAILSPELRAVADHWHGVRGKRLMPAWKDIDPGAIGRNLRYVWAWKYDRAVDKFIGRLAGDEIVQAFGKSPHGKSLAEFMPPHLYRVFFPMQRRVVTEPAAMRGTGMIYSGLGFNFTGERIIMPLADDGRNGDGIIGATFYRRFENEDDAASRADLSRDHVAFFPLRTALEGPAPV